MTNPPKARLGNKTKSGRHPWNTGLPASYARPSAKLARAIAARPVEKRENRAQWSNKEEWGESFFCGIVATLLKERGNLTLQDVRVLNTFLPDAIREICASSGRYFRAVFQPLLDSLNEHEWTLGQMALSHAYRTELAYVDRATRTVRARAVSQTLQQVVDKAPPEVRRVVDLLQEGFDLLELTKGEKSSG